MEPQHSYTQRTRREHTAAGGARCEIHTRRGTREDVDVAAAAMVVAEMWLRRHKDQNHSLGLLLIIACSDQSYNQAQRSAQPAASELLVIRWLARRWLSCVAFQALIPTVRLTKDQLL